MIDLVSDWLEAYAVDTERIGRWVTLIAIWSAVGAWVLLWVDRLRW